jgi:predicted DNA-binding transcriptional regulator AlpA
MQDQNVIGTEPESELLREPEVEDRYKFTRPWLRKNRRLKIGPPFIRVGRMVLYRRSDLDAFVTAHRVEPKNSRDTRTASGGRTPNPSAQ